MERTTILEAVNKIGEEVTLKGWVHGRRDMGKIIFIDLRDRSGVMQIVCAAPEVVQMANELRSEYVVSLRGLVKARSARAINEKIPTGKVEVEALSIDILNISKTPPFELDKDTRAVNEEVRLKYRYLDLRSERLKNNLVLRHNLLKTCRDTLSEQGFLEIETPVLTKGTPEGAREFIVPARLHPGQAYVLPQSPQQFKQLLMVAGIEKYFQVAKCFRDEDQRGDRQPEFTQLDLEMSFVERPDVMAVIENLLIKLVQELCPEKRIQTLPFPHITYKEAMEKYGTDRPDTREDKNDPNLLAFCWVVDFPFFEKTEEGGWTFTHNPFSKPMPEHQELLLAKKNIGEILTTQYDIVLNGFEIGGGSIRNHESAALEKVFEIMGIEMEEIKSKFGHMLEAFEYGAPPHGGIALGFDRLAALLSGEANIREVIAFPKTGDARDPMMGAPSEVGAKQLRDVHVKWDL